MKSIKWGRVGIGFALVIIGIAVMIAGVQIVGVVVAMAGLIIFSFLSGLPGPGILSSIDDD